MRSCKIIINKTLLVLLCLSLTAAIVCAKESMTGSMLISWKANPEPDIAGYTVYIGLRRDTYTQIIDAKNKTSLQVDRLLTHKKYYIVIKAYDLSGNQSGFSREIVFKIGK